MPLVDPDPHKAQVAALPVRGKAGAYEVLLVSSRDSGRWIIPKGWPMKGKEDHETAAQEAFEEAGVMGKIHRHPMGAYTYDKRQRTGVEPIRVMVYLLEVAEKLKDWPEKGERKRTWMAPSEAALMVDEAGLSGILLRVNASPDAGAPKP